MNTAEISSQERDPKSEITGRGGDAFARSSIQKVGIVELLNNLMCVPADLLIFGTDLRKYPAHADLHLRRNRKLGENNE
jgi:hypothetical protein